MHTRKTAHRIPRSRSTATPRLSIPPGPASRPRQPQGTVLPRAGRSSAIPSGRRCEWGCSLPRFVRHRSYATPTPQRVRGKSAPRTQDSLSRGCASVIRSLTVEERHQLRCPAIPSTPSSQQHFPPVTTNNCHSDAKQRNLTRHANTTSCNRQEPRTIETCPARFYVPFASPR